MIIQFYIIEAPFTISVLSIQIANHSNIPISIQDKSESLFVALQ